MNLTEIHQRLSKEFPGRYVKFRVEVVSFAFSNGVIDADLQAASASIYDAKLDVTLGCSNLEDGINQLKLKLGMIQAEMSIEV